ncbi:MAG TPA: hypothetical protein VGM83_16365 [Devosiaceae bacterium]|jgi:hypothetical protein
MTSAIDRVVTSNDVVLLERTDPQAYRSWALALIGGVGSVSSEILEQIPSPEEELKTLLDRMLPGDELWLARSRVYEPRALIGSKGIAIVRNGEPVWYRILLHH